MRYVLNVLVYLDFGANLFHNDELSKMKQTAE